MTDVAIDRKIRVTAISYILAFLLSFSLARLYSITIWSSIILATIVSYTVLLANIPHSLLDKLYTSTAIVDLYVTSTFVTVFLVLLYLILSIFQDRDCLEVKNRCNLNIL